MLNHGSSPNVTPHPCPFFLLLSVAGSGQDMAFHWLYQFYCCTYSSKTKGLRKGILQKLFLSGPLHSLSYSLEPKLQGRTNSFSCLIVQMLMLLQEPLITLQIRDDRCPSLIFPTHLRRSLFPDHLISLFIKGRTDFLLQDAHGNSLPGLIPLKNFHPRAYLCCRMSWDFQPRVLCSVLCPNSSWQGNSKWQLSNPPVVIDEEVGVAADIESITPLCKSPGASLEPSQ